jgi:uncharacterized protein (DUF433 family)
MPALSEKAMLTASEAAAVTRVPVKQVNRIVDAGLLAGRARGRPGQRLIDSEALVALLVAHRTADTLQPAARRALIETLSRSNPPHVRLEDGVSVDVRRFDVEVKRGVGALGRAGLMVVSDPAVLGGRPCFKGTRIPVHDVAEMLDNGDPPEAVLAAYSRLKPAQLAAARLYAEAYPRRGRPPGPTLRRVAQPTVTGSLRLEDLPPV